MLRAKTIMLGLAFACQAIGVVEAQSLRVSPITIDLLPVATSSFLNVGTNSDKPITVQARVFRWMQVDGEDKLQKTGDVVVSPPFLTVSANSGAIVRVVRISQSPVVGEESYRVLLDEIPDRGRLRAGTVAFALRQSVPVFFNGMDAVRGELHWSLENRGRKTFLCAANAGQKRVKLTSLRVTDGAARRFISIDGLAGYVLGGQSRRWELPLPGNGLPAGTVLTIEAKSDAGPINVPAAVEKSG